MAHQSVFAMSKEDVRQKLNVILVYAVMSQRNDGKAQLMFLNRDGVLTMPIFYEQQDALAFQKEMVGSAPEKKPVAVGTSLQKILQMIDEFKSESANENLVFSTPLTGRQSDFAKAKDLMKNQGLTEQQIQEGLQVPVFYTDPMISVQTSAGRKSVFFFEVSQLQEFGKKSFGELTFKEDFELRTADLNAVLSDLQSRDEDLFYFYPNSGYIKANPSVVGEVKD